MLVTIDNLTISGGDRGITTWMNIGIRIRNSKIEGYKNRGLAIQGGSVLEARNLVIDGSYSGASSEEQGLRMWGESNAYIDNFTVSNNQNYGITHTIPYKLVDDRLAKNLIDSYKTTCRVCGGGFVHYLSLGLSPLANNLNNNKNESNDLYPLDLNYCIECSNSQLSVVVPPEKMFDEYYKVIKSLFR